MDEDLQKILEESKTLIGNSKRLGAELEEMKHGKEFLLEQYKTRKGWFRDEPGRVTIEDIIKTAFEFGWSSRRNFEHKQQSNR